jgi:acetyltransferase-like isoleucine patch superfamily enzyme
MTAAGGGSPAMMRAWFSDYRRVRKMARDLRRGTVPPVPERFGSFGTSFIVPPVRVDSPQYIFIGDGVHVMEYAWFAIFKRFDDVEPRMVVGDRTRIGRYCQFSCVGEILVEEDVGISDCVLLADTSHHYDDPTLPWYRQAMIRPKPVVIRAGAAVGYAAVILPGVTVGARAYVSEGAVVGEDVPPGAVVAGNPARVVSAGDRMRS